MVPVVSHKEGSSELHTSKACITDCDAWGAVDILVYFLPFVREQPPWWWLVIAILSHLYRLNCSEVRELNVTGYRGTHHQGQELCPHRNHFRTYPQLHRCQNPSALDSRPEDSCPDHCPLHHCLHRCHRRLQSRLIVAKNLQNDDFVCNQFQYKYRDFF